MAGFVGFFNFDNLGSVIKNSMNKISYRGDDFFCIYSNDYFNSKSSLNEIFDKDIIFDDFVFGYLGLKEDKISNFKNSILVCDSSIYNWEELNEKYSLNAKSEFDFLHLFLNKFGIDKVDELKGAYAFGYYNENKLYLFRDVIGIKPLCFFSDGLKFEFGSESKALSKDADELVPKKYLVYDTLSNKVEIKDRKRYYDVSSVTPGTYEEVKKQVKDRFLLSVKKQLNCKKIGILFSGGTDSTLMAFILKELGVDFTCYTASICVGNVTEGEDIFYARKIAAECGFDWRLVESNSEDVIESTKKVMDIIENRNYVKVSVALPLYIALRKAREEGVGIMFSGIGSEEVFADYKRAQDIEDINAICLEGLGNLWIRDLYRDDTIARFNKIELKFPFLDDDFVNYCIKIDPSFKINKKTNINKVIVRDILNDFGLSHDLVYRTKKAAQYGSRSDRVFEKLANKKKLGKQQFLDSL